jgi:monofunctional biosynthetic peptidoglycan transglycosylase
MQKALEKNQKRGRFVAGGSTISQQLAKNLFLTPTKSYFRKAEEAIITLMLENLWSKRRIFEVYLNVIEWGNGVFGAEAAARHYFNVGAAQLGPEQAARNWPAWCPIRASTTAIAGRPGWGARRGSSWPHAGAEVP